MTHNPKPEETQKAGAPRGKDDRRGTVSPEQNPAPSSPEADHEAVRKGEEALERVKPY